jgi:hypothetical protein
MEHVLAQMTVAAGIELEMQQSENPDVLTRNEMKVAGKKQPTTFLFFASLLAV